MENTLKFKLKEILWHTSIGLVLKQVLEAVKIDYEGEEDIYHILYEDYLSAKDDDYVKVWHYCEPDLCFEMLKSEIIIISEI